MIYLEPIEPPPEFGIRIEFAKNQEQFEPIVGRLDPLGAATFEWSFTEEERNAIFGGANLLVVIETYNRGLSPHRMWVEGFGAEDE